MAFLQQGGSAIVAIPAGQSIILGAYRNALATLLVPIGQKGGPTSTIQDGIATFGAYPAATTVTVVATYGECEYVVGASPVLTDNTFNPNAIVATGLARVTIAGTGTTLTNPNIQCTNSVNNFTQVANQNMTAGVSASSDMICYPNNNANDLTGFVDIGVCSSTFSDANYAVTVAGDAYVFGSAVSGAGAVGNLVIATDATGSRNDIVFSTNGYNATANKRVKIKKEGQVTFIPLAADPATPEKGDVYCNSVTNKLKFYNGTAWEVVTSV